MDAQERVRKILAASTEDGHVDVDLIAVALVVMAKVNMHMPWEDFLDRMKKTYDEVVPDDREILQ